MTHRIRFNRSGSSPFVRRFVLLAVVLALLGAFASPRQTEAAALKLHTSTYATTMKCGETDGEEWCTKNGENLPYQVLMIKGNGFTANGVALVSVIDMTTWTTVYDEAVVIADNGRFTLKTGSIEMCADGLPIMVQATDLLTSRSVVTVVAKVCDW